MPRTKGQEVIFTIMMVIVMVYAMVIYNIAIETGEMNNSIFIEAFIELPVMGAIAFVLEILFVGKIVKNIAFKIVDPEKDKRILIILTISALTVCFMCPLMSLAATLIYKDAGVQIISVWLQTTVINFLMALCWQIFFAGPFIRKTFGIMFAKNLRAFKNI